MIKVIRVSNDYHKVCFRKFAKEFGVFISQFHENKVQKFKFKKSDKRYLILKNGEPIGCFQTGNLNVEEKYIVRLFIDKKYRRNGIGRQVFKILHENMCGSNVEFMCLTVDIGNLKAEKFYEKLGYKEYYKKDGFIHLNKWLKVKGEVCD